jgi:hypothetical protein
MGQNFFTLGEVFDSEDRIAESIGRNTQDADDLVGVDAALDFPFFFACPPSRKALRLATSRTTPIAGAKKSSATFSPTTAKQADSSQPCSTTTT